MNQKILRQALCVAAVAFCCRTAGAQATVTLNTFYPAPLGVYTSIITSSSTQLATTSGNVTLATGGGNVGISTGVPQGILDVNSSTSGFIPPRMTSTQMNAIKAPVAGMVVYNTTKNGLYVYTGSAWNPGSPFPSATPLIFVNVEKDDCGWSHTYLGCPSGYTGFGDWHVRASYSQNCDQNNAAIGYYNGPISSGWMILCISNTLISS